MGDLEVVLTPLELREAAQNLTFDLLPEKSRQKYLTVYGNFVSWKKSSKALATSENVLAYFTYLIPNYAPSSLWSIYSMLKTTLIVHENVDISKFSRLPALLKSKSSGYKPKKAKILNDNDIEKFINDALTQEYLLVKVSLIFGIMGALRVDEISKVQIDHVEKQGDLLLVRIPETKTKVAKSFVINKEYCSIIEQYMVLRPNHCQHTRVFVNFQGGKCTIQPVGRNKFAEMPKQIAKFLNLPDADCYTGHIFRRSSTSLLANAGADIQTIMRHGAWKSASIAESYIENSVNYKKRTGDLISSTITLNKRSKNDQQTTTSTSFGKFKHKTPIMCSTSTPLPVNLIDQNTECIIDQNNCENFIIEEDIVMEKNVIEESVIEKNVKSTFTFNNCTVTFNNVK